MATNGSTVQEMTQRKPREMGTGIQANSHLPFKRGGGPFYFKMVLDAQKICNDSTESCQRIHNPVSPVINILGYNTMLVTEVHALVSAQHHSSFPGSYQMLGRSTGQVFCRVYFHCNMSSVFLMGRLGLWALERRLEKYTGTLSPGGFQH